MDPFTYTLGTESRTFSLENDSMTIVIDHVDSAQPPNNRRQVEACENESEAQAVVTKMVADMERGGWTTTATLREEA